MDETKRYNGWTNYETWCANLWMSNDQGSDEHYREMAQQAYDDAEADDSFTRDENAVLALADMLDAEFEEGKTDILENAKLTSSFWADILGAALSEVNWHEIAEHYIEDVEKAEPEETDEE